LPDHASPIVRRRLTVPQSHAILSRGAAMVPRISSHPLREWLKQSPRAIAKVIAAGDYSSSLRR